MRWQQIENIHTWGRIRTRGHANAALLASAILTATAAIFNTLAINELPTALKTHRWGSWTLFACFFLITIGAAYRSLKLKEKEDTGKKKPSHRLRKKYRVKLIRKSYTALIEDRLDRSMFRTAPIELDLLLSSGQDCLARDLPTNFETLLILGQKGAGKTTLLLRLAEDLLRKAQSDSKEPIPILVSLTDWSASLTIKDLLIAHLETKLGIRYDVARYFVGDEEVAPLLDGLDELAAKDRLLCINEINSYISEAKASRIALACNELAYRAVKARMSTHEIATIQPVSRERIRDYLALTPAAHDAKGTLLQSPRLEAVVINLATPLAIELAVSVLEKASASELDQLSTRRGILNHLVDLYIGKALQTPAPYHPERASRWLSWIANCMAEHSEHEIPYNRLHPGWLDPQLRLQAVWSIALTYGVVVGLILGFIQGLIFGFLIGLIIGLITATIISLARVLVDNIPGVSEWFNFTAPSSSRTQNWFRTVVVILIGANIGIIVVTAGAVDAVFAALFLLLQPGVSNVDEFYLSPFITRLVLAYNGKGPWRYPRFLDYVTERGLVLKSGDRYTFKHSVFYEYFLSESTSASAVSARPIG
jgi:hypothetical protein